MRWRQFFPLEKYQCQRNVSYCTVGRRNHVETTTCISCDLTTTFFYSSVFALSSSKPSDSLHHVTPASQGSRFLSHRASLQLLLLLLLSRLLLLTYSLLPPINILTMPMDASASLMHRRYRMYTTRLSEADTDLYPIVEEEPPRRKWPLVAFVACSFSFVVLLSVSAAYSTNDSFDEDSRSARSHYRFPKFDVRNR